MIINITQEDINNGKTNCISCPIKLALQKNFPGRNIIVYWQKIWINYKQYKMTKNCQRFISRFDNGEMVHPFKFHLMEVKC